MVKKDYLQNIVEKERPMFINSVLVNKVNGTQQLQNQNSIDGKHFWEKYVKKQYKILLCFINAPWSCINTWIQFGTIFMFFHQCACAN